MSPRQLRPRVRRARARRTLDIHTLEDRAVPANFGSLAVDSTQAPTELLVRFRDQYAGPGLTAPGVLATTSGAASLAFSTGLIQVPLNGAELTDVLAAYRANPNVLYAEPNYRLSVGQTPNDPQFGDQWGLNNTGQVGGVPDADIDAPEAWDITTGSASTVVAVIDTGIDYLHPDLAANMWRNPGETPGNNQDDDGNGFIDDVFGADTVNNDGNPMDDNDHGTHVAGIIGAVGNNGVGVTGIAWNVRLMAVKCFDATGNGSVADCVEAINYAVSKGATIANASWGGNEPFSQALYDAVKRARDAGQVFVAGAGNGNFIGIGQDNDADPFFPASFDLENIVAVAATDRNDGRAFFSNYGATSVDLGAPGADIRSTIRNNGYETLSGTSMATPHATGVLALVRSQHPTWTYSQIISKVLNSVDPVPSMAGRTTTGGRLNALAAVTDDVTGPRVASTNPWAAVSGPVSSVRITFTEPVDPATFTAADITFTGPTGTIPVTAVNVVAGTNNRKFDVTFSPRTALGNYALTFGPNVLDFTGNPMNQDGDATNGEPTDDRYTANFSIVPFAGRWDFGINTSPVAEGYRQVLPNTAYSSALGFGWQAGTVFGETRQIGTELTRDMNYGRDVTFAADVPDGTYTVTVTMGDTGPYVHEQMAVWLEGAQRDTVSTTGGQVVARSFQVPVRDGQLTLRLQDLGGPDLNAVIQGLEVVYVGPTGPRVVSAVPGGSVMGPVDRVTFTFDEPVQDGSFTMTDVSGLTGPNGPITPLTVNKLTTSRYEVTFAPQTVVGDYGLTVGPDIRDAAGNLMDQDADGTLGETIDDRYTSPFRVVPFVGRYDFGTATSPVAAGYTRVSPASAYTAGTGFGWQGGGLVEAVDRNTGPDLTRDLAYGPDLSFVSDLPNGVYDVTVTVGDAGPWAHDQMALSLEGIQVAILNSPASTTPSSTYRVTINDGQLALRLRDLGGDPNAVLVALDVVWVSPDPVGPRVVSASLAGTITGPVDRVTLTFDEPIQDGTFTSSDVALTGPAGLIAPFAVNKLTDMRYEVVFPAQAATGDYSLTVGPDIRDRAGNLMDQDADGASGESLQDRFTTNFRLVPFVGRYDFGTPTSAVATGYTRVTPAMAYNAGTGFGWLGGGLVEAVERPVGSDLTRDLAYGFDLSFATNVPNGSYDVTLTIGDPANYAHDQMALTLEGMTVATINTAPGEVKTLTYRGAVNDGQLSFRLRDLGGNDVYAVLNGLDVVWAAPDPVGPRVIAATPGGTNMGPIDRVTLTFDEVVQDGSFTVSDVTITGPAGSIAPTAVNRLGDNRFEVVFTAQVATGTYGVTIGPDIRDAAGNLMDQDGDGVPGEAADAFTTPFTLVPFVGRYDFGPAGSPIATGYRLVTPTNNYTAGSGFGWLGGGVVDAAQRATGSDLTRDLAFGPDLSFAADVPNGAYDVTVTLGDTGQWSHDQMALSVEGTQLAVVNTAAGEVKTLTYRVAINDGQFSVRLRDLGGSDMNAVLNGLDVVWAGPDVVGPRVTAVNPAGEILGMVDRVTLTFNEPVQDGSFALADVVGFTGPAGPIVATGVTRLNDTRYEVIFAPQTTDGDYIVTVGPDIRDTAGNLMDQDSDGTNGESTQDRFTAFFHVASAVRFDFGTASSPVAAGYRQVAPNGMYSAGAGFGWLTTGVEAVDRGTGSELTRDLAYARDLQFAADVPNGSYDVTVTVGDTGPWAHDLMAVSLEGTQLATLSTSGGQVLAGTYRVAVNDGQLSFRLQDLGGSDANAVLMGLDVVWAGPDIVGPRVVAGPAGTLMGPVDRVSLTFDEAVQDGTFTAADVNLTGPTGAIAVTAVTRLNDIRYEVTFAPQTAAGNYSMTVGPDVRDRAGNLMDQDRDGTAGEPADDQYTAAFQLTSAVRFDFGTATSNVAAGYTRVTETTTYNTALGYGWQGGSVLSVDRGIGSDLIRDLVYGNDMLFGVNLPNGTYDVTVTVGDAGPYQHDQMLLSLEGVQLATLSTAGGEVLTRTYRVVVNDGQLSFRLRDGGGSDFNAVLNGLEILRVAETDVTVPGG